MSQFRSFTSLVLSLLGSAALMAAPTVTLSDIVTALSSAPCWKASVDYSVSMPQMLDDIIYKIDLESAAAPGDSLAPCSYLIDWRLDNEDSPSAHKSTGFAAYDRGHHYRFATGRPLQEYHLDWDSVPFIPRLTGSSKAVSVQKSARFCELLPQMLAESFRSMMADPAFTFVVHSDTTVSGTKGRIVVDMQRQLSGSSDYAQEGEYVFDGRTLMPLRVTMENNPGTIGEQTVIATYTPLDGTCQPPTEEYLAQRYPEVFEQWRESNYRLENLPGHRLPEFSLPAVDGSRYSRAAADPMAAPTAILVFDPDDSFTAPAVAAVREAMNELPVAAEAIFAALASNPELVEEVVPGQLPGEHRLLSARGLARDCGVAATPSVIIVARDGTVADVIVGYSDSLRSDLVQKMSLMQ